MSTKTVSTIAELEELDWEVPGLPDYEDSPEFVIAATEALEALNGCDLEGEALAYFRDAVPNFYDPGF